MVLVVLIVLYLLLIIYEGYDTTKMLPNLKVVSIKQAISITEFPFYQNLNLFRLRKVTW